MKNLKFIFAFLVFAGFVSCSSDDDSNSNEPSGADRIVGKWRVQQFVFNGEEVPLTDCERQTTVEFMTDGTVKTTEFNLDPETDDCVSEVYTDRWENLGANVYRITDGGESYEVTIIFSNNNNTFTFSAEDEDGSYSTTYVRV